MQRPSFLRICGSTTISGAAIETPDSQFHPCALITTHQTSGTTERPVLFRGLTYATYEEAALQGIDLAFGNSPGMRGHRRLVART